MQLHTTPNKGVGCYPFNRELCTTPTQMPCTGHCMQPCSYPLPQVVVHNCYASLFSEEFTCNPSKCPSTGDCVQILCMPLQHGVVCNPYARSILLEVHTILMQAPLYRRFSANHIKCLSTGGLHATLVQAPFYRWLYTTPIQVDFQLGLCLIPMQVPFHRGLHATPMPAPAEEFAHKPLFRGVACNIHTTL